MVERVDTVNAGKHSEAERELARLTQVGLDLLILSFARAEGMHRDATEYYADLRTNWGLHLKKHGPRVESHLGSRVHGLEGSSPPGRVLPLNQSSETASMSRKQPIHLAISTVLSDSRERCPLRTFTKKFSVAGCILFLPGGPGQRSGEYFKRHCVNMDFLVHAKPNTFRRSREGKYTLLPKSVTIDATAFEVVHDGKRKKQRVVSVPNEDRPADANELQDDKHTEIQWRLLNLGSRLGYRVWAPTNDRGRSWAGNRIGDIRHLLDKLTSQFEPAAMRIVSFIDVIWLQQRTLFAAFEVEHTTPIYSGLLRMADLMTLVPNQDLKWFIVSSEDRFDRFASQVSRPVFQEHCVSPFTLFAASFLFSVYWIHWNAHTTFSMI